jgi:serine/threonine protein phosphatase 1
MRWIVGDIHGMLRPLETVLREVSRIDPQPALYFVGDYVNRGPDSRGVIELLLHLPNARFIRGNHDDVLDQVLHGVCYAENSSAGDRFLAFQWFLEHGLFETLLSYGVSREIIARMITQRTADSISRLIDCFPESHRQFIRNLPVYIEDPDLFVIHAKWPLKQRHTPAELLAPPRLPTPSLRHEILWGRYVDADLRRSPSWTKTGYFGHTPVPTYTEYVDSRVPIVLEKLVLLDTAAALLPDGRLTAYCPDWRQMVQADPSGRLISSDIPGP